MVDAPFNPNQIPGVGPKPPQNAPGLGPNEQEFQSLMQEKPKEAISPLDVNANKKAASVAPSMDSLLKQVDSTQNAIQKLQTNLDFLNSKAQEPAVQNKFKKAYQTLLNDKLTEASDNIQGTAKAANLPLLEQSDTANMKPAAKFLTWISDGQNQLADIKQNLADMSKNNKPISPSSMLLMQVKLAQAQQEIEFSSILLSKVVDAIRQTLNIQIQ